MQAIGRLAATLAFLALWLLPATASAQSTPRQTPFVDPDARWSVLYPDDRLKPERLANGATGFVNAARDGFAVVDTYAAGAGAQGNTGEGFRNRTRDTVGQ